ncbi:unnamed protein product, partial [Oppiella nova]
MTSVAPCVMKASDELRTIVTGCLSGDASNMLSKLCNSESRAEMTKCMGTGFSKITDRSARQAIKGSIKDITACLQNVNTVDDEIPELSERSLNLKKMKNSKASKDVKWEKGHKRGRGGNKLHKTRHSKHGKHGTGMGTGMGAGVGAGMGTGLVSSLFGGSGGANPMKPMQPNVPGTVIDIGVDEHGNFIPTGVSGSNAGGVVVKDPNGNTIPWNEFTNTNNNNNKPITENTANTGNTGNAVDSGYGKGSEVTTDDDLDEGMDEFGRLMKRKGKGTFY